MEDCICFKEKREKKNLENIISKLNIDKSVIKNKAINKIMPKYLYIIILINNIFMLISFLVSPILFYYAKSIENPYFQTCFQFYPLLALIILLILNTIQKFFILEKLNSNNCCVERLKLLLKGQADDNILATKKLKKNFRQIISIYGILLFFIVVSKNYLIYLNIMNNVLSCSNDDIFGFIITRMLLYSSFSGCVFNFLELYLFNGLLERLKDKDLTQNIIRTFKCCGCFKKKKH